MGIYTKKHLIYKITSPDNTAYIGVTSMPIAERWGYHKRRARIPKYSNKPFYKAILHFGPDAFSVEILEECPDRGIASEAERKHIAQHGLDNLYNVVSGGLGKIAQSEAARLFWSSLDEDPEARAAYIQRLCDAQQARGPEAHAHLPKRGQKWQKENPREAYKIAMRALRCAMKVNTTTGAKQAKRDELAARPLKERLLAKHKGVHLSHVRATTKIWAGRSEEEIKEIGQKIGESLKNTLASNPELKAKNAELIMEARKKIDKSVQGPAASRGLKKFWEELRKNPVRYKEYMDARTASLMETIGEKGMKRRKK
jgi:predicted GIY-YIG superfamily endonuclease